MNPPDKRTQLARVAILAGLLSAGLVLKLAANPEPVGSWRNDANFYYHLARHVAEGDGLVTSASLYHQGLRELPRPSTIYPLWPLVLGAVGRLIGLERAATLLPELLYLVALLLLYGLTVRVAGGFGGAPRTLFPRFPALDVGHLAVLLFGMNSRFFASTSLPLTEGLAFTLAFASLLALARVSHAASMAWAAAAGALAALTYLTRSQMIAVPLVVPLVLWVAALRDRARARDALTCSIVVVALVGIWILHLFRITDPFTPWLLVDFPAYRETPELLPFARYVTVDSSWSWLVDRAGGFLVAFDPTSRQSYYLSFGAAVYLVPLAAADLLRRWIVDRRWPRLVDSTDSAVALATIAVGLGGIALVHGHHTKTPLEWWFHWRHGLPMVFLVIAALGYLVGRSGALRALALGLALLSLVRLVPALVAQIEYDYAPFLPAEHRLVAFLDRRETPPLSVTTHAQQLVALSRHRFHLIDCADPPEQTRRYFEYLDLDYLIAYPEDRRCAFLRELLDEFDLVFTAGRGAGHIVVLEPRG
jgi:hypothetical protein